MEDLHQIANDYLWPLGTRVLVALLVFVIGRWIAKLLLRGFDRVMEKSRVDVSLRKFLGDVLYALMFFAVALVSLDSLGVRTTAVVAVLGAAGLAIGLALQGSLSNFAAGVMIILLRPYKVGDTVVIGKYLGRVDAIRVFQTVLITTDNREISIPNGQIIVAPIENLTVLGKRRIDLVVVIMQAIDLAQARALIEQALIDDRVHKEPAPLVEVAELSDASVKLAVRPWANVADTTTLTSDLMGKIKTTLEGASLKFVVGLAPVPAPAPAPIAPWPT